MGTSYCRGTLWCNKTVLFSLSATEMAPNSARWKSRNFYTGTSKGLRNKDEHCDAY